MDLSIPSSHNESAYETIDLSDRLLVVGSGLIALDAILTLAKEGIRTSYVSSTPRLNEGSNVFINGVLDSTFADSQGLGGMSKFWAGQLMKMEKRHFQERLELGFTKFIEYEKYCQASKLVESDYGLSDFNLLRLPLCKRILTKRLPGYEYIFSQFVETNIYSKLIKQIERLNLVELPPLRVMYFENTSSNRVEVTCKNLAGEKILIICRSLLLAAGTIGNTEIVLRSREHSPNRFFQSSPIGQYLVDHPIIDLGTFEVRRSRLLNFKVNQVLLRGNLRIKSKLMPKLTPNEIRSYADAIIEIAPRLTNSYAGNSKLFKKVSSALILLFTYFGVDLRLGRRLIDVTLHLEQVASKQNCIKLDEQSDDVQVWLQLSALDNRSIEKYKLEVQNLLASFGYKRQTEPTSESVIAYHFSGSLRMGENPTQSVVNMNSEIHCNTDVTVLGLSNFPTTGFTNPTFSGLVFNRILLSKFQSREAK